MCGLSTIVFRKTLLQYQVFVFVLFCFGVYGAVFDSKSIDAYESSLEKGVCGWGGSWCLIGPSCVWIWFSGFYMFFPILTKIDQQISLFQFDLVFVSSIASTSPVERAWMFRTGESFAAKQLRPWSHYIEPVQLKKIKEDTKIDIPGCQIMPWANHKCIRISQYTGVRGNNTTATRQIARYRRPSATVQDEKRTCPEHFYSFHLFVSALVGFLCFLGLVFHLFDN